MNGLITGFLIENGLWLNLRDKFNGRITILKSSCIIIFLITQTILMLQKNIFSNLTEISAFGSSTCHVLLSIFLCIMILDDSYFLCAEYILKMKIWKKIRRIMRTSYVFHMMIFQLIKWSIPLGFSYNWINNFHFIVVLIINFIICFVIYSKFEKNVQEYFKSNSKVFLSQMIEAII